VAQLTSSKILETKPTMKTLGLLCGMSPQSTLLYYKLLNNRIADRLGGLNSAKLVMYSFNFDELEKLQSANRWDDAATLLSTQAMKLKEVGAEAILICANTFHIVADAVEKATGLKVLHIADYTAAAIKKAGFSKVGLLGTKYTMEMGFYKDRLVEKHGLEVLIPEKNERDDTHAIIYHELCRGIVTKESTDRYVSVIGELKKNGAQCVILGCTEIQMLIDESNSSLPPFDTVKLHAEGAADWSLE
jgi:aspartate racemase